MSTSQSELVPARREVEPVTGESLSPPQSASLEKLAAALAKAQGGIKGAVKDSTNPHFGSAYADLASVWEAIRGPLSANGLAVIQRSLATDGTTVALSTLLLHDSGQWVDSVLILRPVKPDPQGIGSALTYARRYALMAMVGVAPEDDDGQAASQPQPRGRSARAEGADASAAAKPTAGPAQPVKATAAQIAKIKTEWKARGLPVEREAYLAELSRRAGRLVPSSVDLTIDEASHVIRSFQPTGQQDMPGTRAGGRP